MQQCTGVQHSKIASVVPHIRLVSKRLRGIVIPFIGLTVLELWRGFSNLTLIV
jgi:recombinational DNA repair protein (RecF pathway)